MKKICITQICMLLCIMLVSCSGGNDDTAPEQQDTEKPTIDCLSDITINITATENETVVTYTAPLGSDNVSATTTQTAGLASGELFPLGTTTNTFKAIDAAGNSATCSFNVIVIRDEPSGNAPYFIGENPTPTGKKWVKVDDLSDEFEGTTFDDSKWHRDPATDPFRWFGRPPALFESDNVTVGDGNLRVTVEKFASPKTVNGTTWTHGGAILRSKTKAKHGQYYECRMQANKTVMSSTFWIAYPQNCTNGPTRKLELDIQECVGRVHSGTATWAKDWNKIYHSNTWRHARGCDIATSQQSPGKTVLTEENNSRFFVYGCWWKSPTEILFYLDGKYAYTIIPKTDFDIEGHITMAMETYDWNPIDDNNILGTASVEDRTTKYDWVRTWKLEDM